MMRTIKKILSFDSAIMILSVLCIITFISAAMISAYTGNIGKTNQALKAELSQLQSLKDEVVEIKGLVDAKEKKIGMTRATGGVVSALEQVLHSLNLKARVIKPLGKNRAKEYTEEDAEVEVQDADLNSIVNLLYRIDNTPSPMKIKNASRKTAFEDPDKFILKITVSMISKG